MSRAERRLDVRLDSANLLPGTRSESRSREYTAATARTCPTEPSAQVLRCRTASPRTLREDTPLASAAVRMRKPPHSSQRGDSSNTCRRPCDSQCRRQRGPAEGSGGRTGFPPDQRESDSGRRDRRTSAEPTFGRLSVESQARRNIKRVGARQEPGQVAAATNQALTLPPEIALN